MIGFALTTVSPSSSSTTRSTPCVDGCCGPMLRVMVSVRTVSHLLGFEHGEVGLVAQEGGHLDQAVGRDHQRVVAHRLPGLPLDGRAGEALAQALLDPGGGQGHQAAPFFLRGGASVSVPTWTFEARIFSWSF